MARAGESTISRTMARELHGHEHLEAGFLFSHGEGDVGYAESFVTTIASQPIASEHLAMGCKQTPRAGSERIDSYFSSGFMSSAKAISAGKVGPYCLWLIIATLAWDVRRPSPARYATQSLVRDIG
jgi:hypothetical protein